LRDYGPKEDEYFVHPTQKYLKNLLACQQIERIHIICPMIFSHVLIALKMKLMPIYAKYRRNCRNGSDQRFE
jgi:hypothetical protein